MAERRLVIVESPAKAKTIAGYLGDGYVVESSIGHIRDLPNRAADIPAAVKKEPWARLGVNVDDDVPAAVRRRSRQEEEGRRAEAGAEGRDRAPTRDGRGSRGRGDRLASARGLEAQGPRQADGVPRDHPRCDRASARRDPGDRRASWSTRRRRAGSSTGSYGYEVSPVLWKKVMQGLSAGRVQSVATRLVVERERSGWLRRGVLLGHPRHVRARNLRGQARRRRRSRVAQGRDFGDDGRLKSDILALDEEAARTLAAALAGSPFAVRSVEEKPYTRRPAAPFMTSTLQQEASRKLRFSSQTTMRVAQRLYENGYITYMRTDSTTLSESALDGGSPQAAQLYGAEVRPGRAAPLRAQGEERPGGARGDPSGRRRVPDPAEVRTRALP